MLRRFELLAPHKQAIASIARSPDGSPSEWLHVFASALDSQGWALAAAGLERPRISGDLHRLGRDLGHEIGVKKSSAQIARHYTPETLVGRQIAAVINCPPRQIGKFMSEVLTLGFPDADGEVVLAAIERPVPNGGRLC